MNATEQFRIVAKPFGYPMYAAPVGGPDWSDRADEAHVYDHRDNPETKLKWWKAQLGSYGIDATTVAVEYL